MNEERGNAPVRAERVAAKIAKIKNFELPALAEEIESDPRFMEIFWFLQWASEPVNYPGGLKRFSDDLVSESKEFVGTPTMQEIGCRPYTLEEEATIEEELNPQIHLHKLMSLFAERREEEKPVKRAKKGREHYVQECIGDANNNLADYLFELSEVSHVQFTRRDCTEPCPERHIGWKKAPAYFARVSDAILAFMDRRKACIASRIGETEITRDIAKWLEVARSAKRAVLIIGTERFGKSEAVQNWCLQNPGMTRLVQVPSSTAECDLLREVAKALGIHCGPRERGFRLREMIDFVLQHSRLMLVFDEAQFIFPGNYTKTTAPARLNWLRRNVMDKGIPAALVATPQSYRPAKDRFVKKTGFAIGQFDERLLKTVHLPNEISRSDLISIARIHFPALAEQYLEFVVAKTIATERNFVSDIEKIATLARVSADQAERKSPTLADIKNAIADVLPQPDNTSEGQAQRETPAPGKPLSTALQRRCKAAAEPVQHSRLQTDFLGHTRIKTPVEIPG